MTQKIANTLLRDVVVGIAFAVLLLVSKEWHGFPRKTLKALWVLAFFRLLTGARLPLPLLKAVAPQQAIATATAAHDANFPAGNLVPPGVGRATQGASPYLILWGVVFLLLVARALWQTAALAYKVRVCTPVGDRVYLAPECETPFVFGWIRPKIFLPLALTEAQRDFAIRHEQQHIRAGDQVLKLLVYGVVLLHWYNPLAWLAYTAFSDDMEQVCDERVVNHMNHKERISYAQALLGVAGTAGGGTAYLNTFAVHSLAAAKSRIRHIMTYQSRKSLLCPALVLTVVLCSCTKAVPQTALPTAAPTTVVAAPSMAKTEAKPTAVASKTAEEEENPKVSPSVSYLPSLFTGIVQQTFDYGAETNRTCTRVATPDSKQYVMLQSTPQGTDAISLDGATESVGSAGGSFLVSPAAIHFAEDATRFPLNLPQEGDSILYFTLNGSDCLVYGTVSRAELEKVAAGISVLPPGNA